MSRRGFTLVETMVALALLAVIVVTILSAFSATTLAVARHQQQTSLDRLTRSDAEFVKSQTYVVSAGANGYGNIAAAGYSFSYQVLYCDPVLATCTALPPVVGLQEILLTVSGPNGSQQTLDFMKVQP
jgi:prepilin-type N-terminal cleavage/methylation domain-containing protein